MEVLSFDVCGKMAHFRKYYANNTAFSYSIPPRTTIMGILGAMLGEQRDTYYEAFSSVHLRIGVRVLEPVKKTFHRLNFLSIKSLGDALKGTGDFTGAEGHIQTPFEVVTGLHLGKDVVKYRIFIAKGTQDNGVFDRICKDVLTGRQHYNITLGTANFIAWVENPRIENATQADPAGAFIRMHSALPSSTVLSLQHLQEEDNFLEEELLPADFKADNDRELAKLVRAIFSTRGLPFSVRLNVPYFVVPDQIGEPQNILFLE